MISVRVELEVGIDYSRTATAGFWAGKALHVSMILVLVSCSAGRVGEGHCARGYPTDESLDTRASRRERLANRLDLMRRRDDNSLDSLIVEPGAVALRESFVAPGMRADIIPVNAQK